MADILQFKQREQAHSQGWASCQHCRHKWQAVSPVGEAMNVDANQAEAHVNDDFGTRKGTDAGLQEITKGRALNDISREGWLDVLRWRGELPEDFDPETDAERLSQEGPPLASIREPAGGADNASA